MMPRMDGAPRMLYVEKELLSLSVSAWASVCAAVLTWALVRRRTHGRGGYER